MERLELPEIRPYNKSSFHRIRWEELLCYIGKTMRSARLISFSFAVLLLAPLGVRAATFSDVTNTTYERDIIRRVIADGWMKPLSETKFGYGVNISPNDWYFLLMFARTKDACPELGMTPNEYWSADNIRNCLSGAGVPVLAADATLIRRDEGMQQLFALRRQSFAFQELQTTPAGYSGPTDLTTIPADRMGAMIAADRLKLLFRYGGKILPASPLLREDAALAVTRFRDWEKQGGVSKETNDKLTISDNAVLNHWRDLDTDIYVIQVKNAGDTEVRPIMPRRSFNPAATSTAGVRDEYVYQPVSSLAKESGALAAINGSYFNVQWPWGALEDVAIVDGKTLLMRSDRSTFIVCGNGKMYVMSYDDKKLKAEGCAPKHALGAGPLFMSAGETLTQSTKEGFDEYTQWERRVGSNARTAVAVSADRKTAYLIVVAGKSYPAFGRGGDSLGTFLKSKYADISDAMMFDGGGSTALFAKGAVLVGTGESGNTTERAVVSALGIFSKKADAAAQTAYKNAIAKYWDSEVVSVKNVRPTKPFAWVSAKQASDKEVTISMNGSRGSTIKLLDTKKKLLTFNFTFDQVATDPKQKLTVARREGTHEKGWNIPTEMHVIDAKDGTDTDIIRLFAYMPANQKPDLKTFDALQFGKTGIIFGDATGKAWFYYGKTKQLMPATFLK
jgi:exopolysaccharide biosynthesis protein